MNYLQTPVEIARLSESGKGNFTFGFLICRMRSAVLKFDVSEQPSAS